MKNTENCLTIRLIFNNFKFQNVQTNLNNKKTSIFSLIFFKSVNILRISYLLTDISRHQQTLKKQFFGSTSQ